MRDKYHVVNMTLNDVALLVRIIEQYNDKLTLMGKSNEMVGVEIEDKVLKNIERFIIGSSCSVT